ncbi:unnamed protein product [Umbelopsis sp. WA50703]|jgi:hypothetical protein
MYLIVENTETSNNEQVEQSEAGDLMDVLENGADHWDNVEVSNVDVSNSKVTPTITLSTSSFLQVASRCPNLTFLELSNTALFCDSLILETGEYVSSIQTFALQPGLTHVRIDLDQAIRALGTQCPSLTQINIQACDWVTAKVIWCWASNCLNLQKLDARRCLRCGIERLTSAALDITGWEEERDLFSLFPKQNDDVWSNPNQYSRSEDNRTNFHDDEEVSWMTNSHLAEYSVPTPSVFARDRRQSSVENRTVQPNTLMHNTTLQNSASQAISSHHNKQSIPITLRSLVYSILKEAKESGISDINWLHDE